MYITPSGIPVPQGSDVFAPTTQLKNMADAASAYDFMVVKDTESDRNNITAPMLRDGLFCYVKATKKTWRREGTTWVDRSFDDTGWITPTLGSGWSVSAGLSIQYRRIGGVVFLHGQGTGGSSGDAFTLPAGFRPSQQMWEAVISGTGATPAMTRVGVNPSTGGVSLVSGAQPNLDAIRFIADA